MMDGRDTMHVWSGAIERFDCAEAGSDEHSAGSFGRIWLISHDLSTNEQYFSLTPN